MWSENHQSPSLSYQYSPIFRISWIDSQVTGSELPKIGHFIRNFRVYTFSVWIYKCFGQKNLKLFAFDQIFFWFFTFQRSVCQQFGKNGPKLVGENQKFPCFSLKLFILSKIVPISRSVWGSSAKFVQFFVVYWWICQPSTLIQCELISFNKSKLPIFRFSNIISILFKLVNL